MMDVFADAASWILLQEGEWNRGPDEPGAVTRWGISSRAYPNVNLDTLTRDGAIDIYRRDYWVPLRGDELPLPFGLPALDGAIQHSVRTAVKFLQQSSGTTPDGIMGPHTLAALRRGSWEEVLVDYLARRARLYAIAPKSEMYAFGWYRRLFNLQRHIYEGGI